MTNREEVGRPKSEDRSWKTEAGRPKLEDRSRKSEVENSIAGRNPDRSVGNRSRHGPSTRGDPDIRGKPTLGVGVSNSNITDLESPPPGTVISTKERSLSNKVAVNNMRFLSCFLRSPLGGKPEGKGARSWLQWESRVLAAKNPEDEVGVFIPNRECYAEKEEEAPPNLPSDDGKGQEKRGRGRPETEDRRKSQLADCHLEGGTTERSLSNKVAQSGMRFLSAFGMTATGKTTRLAVRNRLTHILQTSEMTEKENVEYRSGDLEALKGRKITAQGNALCQENNVNFFAPRSVVIQGGAVAWGNNNNTHLTKKRNEENIQYSTINIQCKSWETKAPTGRNLIAQGVALCNECNADFVAPRSTANYGNTVTWGKKENVEYRMMINECRSLRKSGGAIAWGKIAKVENCSRLTTTIINMSKKHDLKVFPSRGENPEGKRGQKKNTINKVSIAGMRFRVEPGMTATGKTTRLAGRNRLTHNTQPSQLTYQPMTNLK